MDVFPFDYVPIPPTTWAYLSSFLMLALFFKFNRFWSFRNLDLILIMLLAPGLLMIDGGQRHVASQKKGQTEFEQLLTCLLYTSPSPRDKRQSRMPSSA